MAKTKRPIDVSYACGWCDASCRAPLTSALALLQLCEGCQAKRFAAGTEARRKAEAQEAARG